MPRYIPPREALGEYMSSDKGKLFVDEFLIMNGAEMLDDLLDNATLPYVGPRWQQKLMAAFREQQAKPRACETPIEWQRAIERSAARRWPENCSEKFDFIDQ